MTFTPSLIRYRSTVIAYPLDETREIVVAGTGPEAVEVLRMAVEGYQA